MIGAGARLIGLAAAKIASSPTPLVFCLEATVSNESRCLRVTQTEPSGRPEKYMHLHGAEFRGRFRCEFV
jgi:hypothetical protein